MMFYFKMVFTYCYALILRGGEISLTRTIEIVSLKF